MENLLRRILCFDYGSARIGIAVSDPLGIIARPVGFVEQNKSAIAQINELVQEFDPAEIVVGYPLNLKGERGQKAIEVDGFINLLEEKLQLSVVRWDERFTTKIASQSMRESGMKKKERESKKHIDAIAAALILQSYLDYRKSK
jgi:putative holliday junction resolvase